MTHQGIQSDRIRLQTLKSLKVLLTDAGGAFATAVRTSPPGCTQLELTPISSAVACAVSSLLNNNCMSFVSWGYIVGLDRGYI